VFKEKLRKHLNRLKSKRESTLDAAIRKVKELARPDTWASNHENCYRCTIGQGESEAHARAKFERFLYWRQLGCSVFVELRWAGSRGRSDLVICMNNGEVLIEEIANSETEQSLIEKETKYPFPIAIIRCF